jgi:DNA-binding NarL/FixJ family response regulator
MVRRKQGLRSTPARPELRSRRSADEVLRELIAGFHEEESGRAPSALDPGVKAVRERARGTDPEVLARVDREGYRYVLTRTPLVPAAALSPRERQVAVLVRDGLTNKAIAYRLGLRRSTVTTHLRHVYQKLRINSRVLLACRAPELEG